MNARRWQHSAFAWMLFAIATVFCTAATPADKAAGESLFPAARRAAIDATLKEALAASGAPGAVVGIWISGQGSYVKAIGVSDPATGKAIRVDDHFRIGSITKTFTITALLQLAQAKKLRLDDPVSDYLPFVPNGKNITLRMLANMTSGLYSYTEDDAWVKVAFSNFQRVWTPRELVDVGLAHAPNFPPGTAWHYSNTNTVLVGMVIEQVTGKPIRSVFVDQIFRPLGLKQTSWPTTSAMPVPYAHGVTVQTLDDRRDDATNRNPSWGFTAGELISTLGDLKIWVRSYTTGSLISPELQKERLTWVTLPPNTPQRKYGLGIGSDHGWLGHTGELPGYNTAAYFLPEKDATVVVLVNSDIPANGGNPAPIIFKMLAKELTPNNVPQ